MTYEPDDLKALREKLGLSQAQLADEIGVNRSNVTRWEQGATKPRGPACKLLDALREKAERTGAELAS